MWVEAKSCFSDFTSIPVKCRTGVAAPFLSGFPSLRLPLLPDHLSFRFINLCTHLTLINVQFTTDKWDLQTQAGAPDDRRQMEMAGSAQIGEVNERRLLLLTHPPSFHSRWHYCSASSPRPVSWS